MANGDALPAAVVDGHDKWLSQGDIFRSIPIAFASVGQGAPKISYSLGPAVLMTHSCAIDKRKAGALTIERLHFLPLVATEGLGQQRVAEMRSNALKLAPYEALYVGAVDDLGECYVVMSDPVQLPARYFSLRGEPMPTDSTDSRACPGANDTRLGRVDDRSLELLGAKWTAFWTRIVDTRRWGT